jgi:uncharacterized protein with GYD domain
MPTYAILYNYTDQGLREIKHSPGRIKDLVAQYEHLGVKTHGIYLTTGPYDLIEIVEIPNEQIGLVGLLQKAMGGNVRTTTLQAFSLEEFEQAADHLP